MFYTMFNTKTNKFLKFNLFLGDMVELVKFSKYPTKFFDTKKEATDYLKFYKEQCKDNSVKVIRLNLEI